MSLQTSQPSRVAIVTGAAQGIGAATASRLAADGYAVAAVDLDPAACEAIAKEIVWVGGRAITVGADVSDPVQVEEAVARVAAELGPPTVLVNNAGAPRDNLLSEMTEFDWDAVMNVHLRGSFLMSRATQRYMAERGWGRIVNVSGGSSIDSPGQANLATANAGLQGFTRTLANELGPLGITVNAVAPGFIATAMTAARAERFGVGFDQFQEAAATHIPVRRVGAPEDVAHAIAFLAAVASGFISGQVLYIAGGPLC